VFVQVVDITPAELLRLVKAGGRGDPKLVTVE
jgi:hypothetical protein